MPDEVKPQAAPAAPVAPAAAAPAASAAPAIPAAPKEEGSYFDNLVDRPLYIEGVDAPKPDATPAAAAAAPEKPATPAAAAPAPESKPPEPTPGDKPAAPKPADTPAAPKPEDKKKILNRFENMGEVRKALSEVVRELSKVDRENGDLAGQLKLAVADEGPLVITATSDEELVEAYREAELRFTRSTQLRSRLRKQAAEKPVADDKPEDGYTKEDLADLAIKDPEKFYQVMRDRERKKEAKQQELLEEKQKQAQEEVERVVTDFRSKHPDIAEYEAAMNDIIQHELPKGIAYDRLIQIAYDTAKGRKVAEIAETVRKKTEEEVLLRTKPQAETGAGAGGGRAASTQENPEDEIRKSITAASQKDGLFGAL